MVQERKGASGCYLEDDSSLAAGLDFRLYD